MPRPVRIALCQFASVAPEDSPHASADNLARAHAFVAQAAAAKANLVVFPEYFISGIIADPQHHHLAQRAHDPSAVPDPSTTASWLESFRALAVKHSIDIVAGTIVERAPEAAADGKPVLRNCAHYISRTGEIVGRYQKQNLWWPEKDYLTRGEGINKVFETEWGRTGMLVCWDIAFPEAFRSLVLQNVEIVICPTFWTATDGDPIGLQHEPLCETIFLDNTIVARAFENECAVVFVNVGGKKEDGYIGRSAVTLPFKGVVRAAKSNEEELVIVDIDLDILTDAKKVYGIRRDVVANMQKAGVLPEGITP